MGLFNVIVSYQSKRYKDIRYYQPIAANVTGVYTDKALSCLLNSKARAKDHGYLLPNNLTDHSKNSILGLSNISLYCDRSFISIQSCLASLEKLDFILVCHEVTEIRVKWYTLKDYGEKLKGLDSTSPKKGCCSVQNLHIRKRG